MLHCHVSTVTMALERFFSFLLPFLVAAVVEGEARGVQLVVICQTLFIR